MAGQRTQRAAISQRGSVRGRAAPRQGHRPTPPKTKFPRSKHWAGYLLTGDRTSSPATNGLRVVPYSVKPSSSAMWRNTSSVSTRAIEGSSS